MEGNVKMTIQEVKDYFRIESVHEFTDENIAEALVGNYDCFFIVNRNRNDRIAFMALIHENQMVSLYVKEENCSRETLDDFCDKYKIVR